MAKSLHTPEYEYFCSLMVRAREDACLTQTEVALRLGRPQSFVAKYELGERRLDVVEFIEICIALEKDSISIISDMKLRVAS
jgi:transcriptional regulator with XRE-family HTH domain